MTKNLSSQEEKMKTSLGDKKERDFVDHKTLIKYQYQAGRWII